MKPGNLLIQGAKSGGRREMRIRYTHIGSFGVRFFMFLAGKPFFQPTVIDKLLKGHYYGKETFYF